MRWRLVLLLAAVALALAGAGAAVFVWRMPRPKPTPKIVAPIEVKPAPQAAPASHVSTIIDAPGEPAPAPVANSQQLDVIAGGENGRPQIKQAILRPKIAQKISALLIESGYEASSAEEVEASAKKLFNVQSLRDGAVALAIGALNPSGAYRCAQLAI